MAILSKTWWRSLVKGDGSPESEVSTSGEEIDQTNAKADNDFLFADLEVSANPPEVETASGEESGQEPQVERGRNRSRGRRERGPRDRRGGSEDRREPREDAPPRLPPRARVASAKDFFTEEAIYRYDLMLPQQREELKGDYRIEVKGNKGGVWSLKIDSSLEIVNRREDADVVLSLQQKDFVQLVNGDLNPQMAILAQKMKVLGDMRSVATLQSLLVPPGFD
jgi:hypothetical protein